MSNAQIAREIAHETIGHKIGGDSEFVAQFVQNAAQDSWGDFQSGNTDFHLTMPISNAQNNAYANHVQFGSGVSPDVAFRLDKGERSPFGHTIGYFQTPEGKWVQYEQMTDDKSISTVGALLNFGYSQLIKTDTKAKDENGQNTIDIKESYLKNDPNIVYIETTKEQDTLITQNVLQQINTMNVTPYKLWTNNCNISFASSCANAGVELSPIAARPDKYFQELQKMYNK